MELRLTSRDLADLRAIAAAWDVPAGSAAYALFSGALRRVHGRKPPSSPLALLLRSLGSAGLLDVAALRRALADGGK